MTKWISIHENEKVFDDYIKTHYEITAAMNKPDVEKIKKTLLKDIQADRKRVKTRKIQGFLKYAAVFVCLMGGVCYYYLQNDLEPKAICVLTPKDEPITITLDDGTSKIIKSEENAIIEDTHGNVIGRQNNAQLTYTQTSEVDKLIYNTLKVPHGKRFDVVLSDGTRVYLNAGTELRYPINFIEGRNRSVFLTGEAYFEVDKG